MNRFLQIQEAPTAMAHVAGGSAAPQISGTVSFFRRSEGVLVVADIRGLPVPEGPCASHVFGFHIHEGRACTGPDFADTGGHFDPEECPHPHHAGDLPPLFADRDGHAWLAVLTDRFPVPDVVGRTVIIHQDPDDFTTQPSGHSGMKMACGVIRAI